MTCNTCQVCLDECVQQGSKAPVLWPGGLSAFGANTNSESLNSRHWMFIMVNMLLNACTHATAFPVDSEAKSSSLQLLPVDRMTTWKE